MNKTRLEIIKNDPITDDVPISKENIDYKTFLVLDGEKEIFIFRMYLLSNSYKEEHMYPLYVNYELGDIYMFPDYRGKGLSKLLLGIFMRYVRPGDKIILWVLGNNAPAIKLYEFFGFTKLAENVEREQKMREEYKWIKESDEIIFFVKHIL